MKKTYLLLQILLVLNIAVASAQTPFRTIDSVDINMINAAVLVHGDMFWDPSTQVAACVYPKGGHTKINFASALWMSGFDAGGTMHVAAQTYRQDGNDYWPGPLDAADTLTYSTSHDWAKIWKVNRTDIQYFQSVTAPDLTNTPPAILTWPAKGNTHAQGNGGAALTVTDDMAPFVDLNHNGIYEPLLGEYPDINGDQALWWVFSDNGPTHTLSNGKPLGVEVHAMAYAYKRNTLIDNVVYFDFQIVNKSPNNYHNFRLGLWDDIDLGYYLDDYIGYDSAHRMGITYNATAVDGDSSSNPSIFFGAHPPIVGMTMISLPGDFGTSYVPAGSYVYFNNDFSSYGNPTNDTQYNNYLRALDRTGAHYTNTFAGPAVSCLSYGMGPNTNYVFTGDPSDANAWSECVCNNAPGDRRFVISTNDFTLSAGSSEHVVMAMVVTDTNQHGCGSGANFNDIKIVADTAWNVFHHPPAPLPPNGIDDINKGGTIRIYPNPAQSLLYVESDDLGIQQASITVFDLLGQTVEVPFTKSNNKISADVSALPRGMYVLSYRTGEVQVRSRFTLE